MSLYHFQFEDFALSDKGVHLLRNRFNFKTITYGQISKAIVTRSAEIRNAVLILILGVAMVCFAFYQSRWVIGLFNDPQVYHIYIESLILPIVPACLGIYCIYSALRKGPILILKEGKKTYRLRLRAAVRKGQGYDFESYLDKQLGARLFIAESIT